MKRVLCFALLLVLSGCGGSGSSSPAPDAPNADTDGDGLTTEQETLYGTQANSVDSDNDGIWDGEEINLYGSDPLVADSDSDGMLDGEDPQPMIFNTEPTDSSSGLKLEYGLFTIQADGSSRQQISSTRYQQNHAVYSPVSTTSKQTILYQTYLADTNADSRFDESDLAASVIAIRNADGSRPRLLTDRDASGTLENNGAVDATPEFSPDGTRIIFVSDRDNPGSFLLKLYVMNADGSNPQALAYAANPPDWANGEIDADPFWGSNNRISFKRQKFSGGQLFSRIYTAQLDPTTRVLSAVTERTSGANITLTTPNGPGDFDPKISPDGSLIASYRHTSDGVPLFGDYDLWIGPFSDSNQPGDASIQFIDSDTTVASLFPRWNISGTKLAAWQLDATAISAATDAVDIVIYDLNLSSSPFSASASKQNITLGDGWFESMPSWNTDPTQSDQLIFSANRLK